MPRNSKVKQAANQQKIVQGIAEGKSQTTIAGELGLARETVNRNLALLRDGLVSASREDFSVYVKQQVDLLTKVIEEVWEGKLPPDAANSIRGLMDSVARLTGSNAPTKSISAHVAGGVQVLPIEEQYEYKQAFAGLYPDERQEELDRVKARKRTCRVVVGEEFIKQLPGSES
jgi:hypothetical protein